MSESKYLIERRERMLRTKEAPAEKKPQRKIAFHSKKREVKKRVYRKIVKGMQAESDICEIRSHVCTGKMQGADHKAKLIKNTIC